MPSIEGTHRNEDTDTGLRNVSSQNSGNSVVSLGMNEQWSNAADAPDLKYFKL